MSINMERSPQAQNLPRGVEPSSDIIPGSNHPLDGAISQWDVTPDIDRNSTYRAPEIYPNSHRTDRSLGRSALALNVPERSTK